VRKRDADIGGRQYSLDCRQDKVCRLAAVMGRADGIIDSQKSFREGIFSHIRFDAAYNAEVEEGLSVGSLEVSTAERIAMRAGLDL
jgi:hypothetical protein